MTDLKDGQEFNDDELQEIMGEIESLEEEFADSGDSSPAGDSSEELDLEEAERQLAELEGDIDEGGHDEETDEIVSELEEEAVQIEAVEDEAVEDEVVMEAVEEDPVVEAVEEEPYEEEHHVEHNVVSMNNPKAGGGHVEFGAHGTMNLDLKFTVAGKEATLKIVDNKLVVDMDGVHFHINDEDGCVFEMPGGVRFQVPLSGNGGVSKAS